MALAWNELSGEALFGALPDPTIIFSADGQVVAANQRAAELFEREMPFPAISVTELLAQPERARLDPLAWMRKWADSPSAPELDYVYLTCCTASGEEKQLSVRVARLTLEQSDTFYLVTMHDVSHREARLRSERDAHRLASQILAISADAVVIVDDDACVTYANESAHKLLGYSAGKLKGESLDRLMPERYRPQHTQFMQEFASEVNPARLMGERAAIVALSRSGDEIPVEASISRISIQGKTVFIALLRDMRQRAED